MMFKSTTLTQNSISMTVNTINKQLFFSSNIYVWVKSIWQTGLKIHLHSLVFKKSFFCPNGLYHSFAYLRYFFQIFSLFLIFFILNIDSEHLYGLAFAFYHFADLRLKHLFQILNPNIVYILFSFYDSWKDEFSRH